MGFALVGLAAGSKAGVQGIMVYLVIERPVQSLAGLATLLAGLIIYGIARWRMARSPM